MRREDLSEAPDLRSPSLQEQPQERSFADRIRAAARAFGFDGVGIARADTPMTIEHARYRAFIAKGMHGSMEYLARHADVRERLDTDAILEGAKSVVCVAKRYARPVSEEAKDSPLVGMVARYAKGRDYHRHLRASLKRLAELIASLSPGGRARALCDIEPVLERAWAARSGLGFVGKNGLVITPGQGSYLLLGEVVTTLELAPDTPVQERCGSCTRCLDVCPTQAFAAPFVLDPRRCVAYITIEDPAMPDTELARAAGEHFFGCDACQDVCPYNRTAPPDLEATAAFRPLPWLGELTLEDVCAMDERRWERLFQGTPLRRAKYTGIVRNAVMAAAAVLRHSQREELRADANRAMGRALEHARPEIRAFAERMRASLDQEDGA